MNATFDDFETQQQCEEFYASDTPEYFPDYLLVPDANDEPVRYVSVAPQVG